MQIISQHPTFLAECFKILTAEVVEVIENLEELFFHCVMCQRLRVHVKFKGMLRLGEMFRML